MNANENKAQSIRLENPVRSKPNSRIRLLCLFNSYTPWNGLIPITGGEVHLLEVGKKWAESGVRMEMITTNVGQALCRDHGFKVNTLVLPFNAGKFGVITSYVLRVFQASFLALRLRHRVTCTYSATDILPDILPACVVKSVNGRKSIMACWVFHLISHFSARPGSKIRNVLSFLSQRLSLSLIRRYSDIIFVDNSIVKAQLTSLGFPNDKIHVIPMGIDKELIDNAKPVPGISYDACYVGRLHVTKGVNDLASVWRLVTDRNKIAKLAVIGSDPPGNILRSLKDQFRNYDLMGNVDFLMSVPHDSVFSFLKTCKVFLFPSYEEGWGIALCEAMAAGLVPVAYDLPPYREFFHGSIITVPTGDSKALANAVIGLLSNEDRRLDLKKKGSICASQYTWYNTADRELRVIAGKLALMDTAELSLLGRISDDESASNDSNQFSRTASSSSQTETD
jgi:glycosyltransferase involved in cell wall biosynthesis